MNVKLQSAVNRKYKAKKSKTTKTYEKFFIVLPAEVVQSLGWKPGDEIDQIEKDGGLLLTKQKKS